MLLVTFVPTWTGSGIRVLAESRALYLSREAGRSLSDCKTGHILGQYRRVLLITFVRSKAACPLTRMGHLGEAARECAGHCEAGDRLWLLGDAAFQMHSFRDADPQPVTPKKGT